MITEDKKKLFGGWVSEIQTDACYCKLVTARGFNGSKALSTTIIATTDPSVAPRVCGQIVYGATQDSGQIQGHHRAMAITIDKHVEEGHHLKEVLNVLMEALKEDGIVLHSTVDL